MEGESAPLSGVHSTKENEMSKLDLSSLYTLTPVELYALFVEHSDIPADCLSRDWRSRLVSGVEYANDRRYEAKVAGRPPSTDEEWKKEVLAIVDIDA
jgi:hypothetical protein